jgi:transposase
MNNYQKLYTTFFVVILTAFGVYFYMGQQLKKTKKLSRRSAKALSDFNKVGEEVHHQQERIRLNKEKLDERSKGDLEMSNVLRIAKTHGLKSPRSTGDDIVDKRTFREKSIKLSLKEEKLKNVIKFLIEVEKLGDSNVKTLTFTRTKKDKDLWDASLTIVKIIPKDI